MIEAELKFEKQDKQPYKKLLFQTAFGFAYYGLFRVGEIAESPHVIRAVNVHRNDEQTKIKIYLFTSKTHGENNEPQKVKFDLSDIEYCPVRLANDFIKIRQDRTDDKEQFFVHENGKPITIKEFRQTLKQLLSRIGVEG